MLEIGLRPQDVLFGAIIATTNTIYVDQYTVLVNYHYHNLCGSLYQGFSTVERELSTISSC